MGKFAVLLITACACTLAYARGALANDQEFVIGLGLGVHSFSQSDDVRKGSNYFGGTDEIKSAGLVQLYGEWYVFDDVGLGLRFISLSGGRTYSSASQQLDQTVTVGSTLITANWILLGSQNYTRLGLIGGLGSATYEVNEKFTDSSGTFAEYDETASTDGTAALLGIYVDWGGEDFGARFGLNSLSTNLDKLKVQGQELDVDGSGVSLYLDLRWAFE